MRKLALDRIQARIQLSLSVFFDKFPIDQDSDLAFDLYNQIIKDAQDLLMNNGYDLEEICKMKFDYDGDESREIFTDYVYNIQDSLDLRTKH